MKGFTQKLFLTLCFISCFVVASAQFSRLSPELGVMYKHAQDYAAAKNYRDAITTYKQLITLAPEEKMFYYELGNVLYLSGNFSEAEKALKPLVENGNADAATYCLLATVQAAQKDAKQAFATLEKGLRKYPRSGMLYYQAGKIYSEENKKEKALNAWLDGIKNDVAFAFNYRDAANAYLMSDRVLWGVIYAEQFLSMQHDTTNDDALKKQLLTAYKTLFNNMVKDEVPEYGKDVKVSAIKDFEDAVMQTYRSLTPVVSDGVTTENLTMMRVRLLMEWSQRYDKKYPFSLFSYQDMQIRNGRFDVYNEWLFGKAESANEYKAWNIYHEGDMQRFLKWQQQNFYEPASDEFYNDRDMSGLFHKKKNK
jgi:tetratricopeptide (TPR) repeat protein